MDEKTETGLIAHYSFDEGAGATAYDDSGHGSHGSFGNGTEWTAGKVGGGVLFDGTVDDYVEVASIDADTTAGAENTVEFWMNWDGTNNVMPITWPGGNYALLVWNDCIGFNTWNSDVLGVSSVGLENDWHHVAGVFYNGQASDTNNALFIDGVRQTPYTCTGGGHNARSVTSELKISGYSTGSWQLGGKIDEVRIYDRALDESEVAAHHAMHA